MKERSFSRVFIIILPVLMAFLIGCCSISYAQQGKVLVIFSGADSISLKGGGTHKTGYFLSEMAIPLILLKNAGYGIEYASPGGVEPAMDKSSDNRQFFKSDEQYLEAKKLAAGIKMRAPRKLSAYNIEELRHFDGIFVPGGHAPMADLYKDAELGSMLRFFHQNKKPTALICHGPVSLLAARDDKGWIYKGYSMTAFSDAEEKEAEKSGSLGGNVMFYICDALAGAGARISNAEKLWQSHVVRDRELITGQNPGSGEELSEVFLEALTAEKLNHKKIYAWPATGKVMTSGEIYDASVAKADWNEGYRTLWIGRRKKDCPEQSFLSRLTEHVNRARQVFEPYGFSGYVIFATGDYEIAYGKWKNKESAQRAFDLKDVKEAIEDGNSFMDKVLFKELTTKPLWLGSSLTVRFYAGGQDE